LWDIEGIELELERLVRSDTIWECMQMWENGFVNKEFGVLGWACVFAAYLYPVWYGTEIFIVWILKPGSSKSCSRLLRETWESGVCYEIILQEKKKHVVCRQEWC